MATESGGPPDGLGGISITPQAFPILAASVANGLSTILTVPQMLLLGNFLSIITSSLFALTNLTVLDKGDSASDAQGPFIPFMDYGPLD